MESNNSNEELEIAKEIEKGTNYAVRSFFFFAISIVLWIGIFIYTSF